ARWHPSFEIDTRHPDGSPWLSGVYLVALTREDGVQHYAIFVLRDDSRDAEVAVQLPTATWQAYNSWGGESLYMSSRNLPGKKARRVSYDRPFIHLLGHGSGFYRYMDHPLVQWIESRGYDVEYITNTDTGAPDGRIGKHRIIVSVGHDEYHSPEAVDRFEAALNAGTSFAFLSGNTMYWAVRYEDGPAGRNKTLVCFKELPDQDPLFATDRRRATGHFRKAPLERPELRFLGVQSNGDSISQPLDWIVQNASHWIYGGTGLKDGDRLPGIVGFEWDSFLNTGQEPAGLVVLSNTPVDAQSGRSYHNAVVYERGNAFLFAASTVWFNRGLAADARVARMMDNLLERAGSQRYDAPAP
ncbi:MAG: N,N-dimethylformamidase beta subunit family domain-containing protein, partial [Myxococcales bacterium]